MESTDTQQLLDQALASQLGSFNDMLPMLFLSVGISLVAFIVIAVISARGRHRERRAIIQTAEDIRIIRELLEKKIDPLRGAVATAHPRPKELENDPQLPAQP